MEHRLLIGLLLVAPAQAAEVSGTVRGFDDDLPLAGVSVRVSDALGGSAVGLTDPEGRYRIEGVDAGRVRVKAVPPDTMNRLGAWWPSAYGFCQADAVVLQEDEAVELDFALPAGGYLEGTVRDGQGLVPAEVSAVGLDFYNANLMRRDSADEGSYSLAGLDSIRIDGLPVDGHYRLSATPEEGAPWYWPGTWSQQEAEPVGAERGAVRQADFVLPDPVALSGQLVDAAGQPIAGAQLRTSLTVTAQSGADGRFEFAALRGGETTLQIDAAGYGRRWWPGVASPALAEPIELSADLGLPALTLEAEVVLQVEFQAQAEGALVSVLHADSSQALASRITDGPALLDFVGLPAEDLIVRVTRGTSDLLVAEVAVPIAGPGAYEASLDPAHGATLSGRVVRQAGLPLRGARLEVWSGGAVIAQASSDGGGSWSLAGLPPDPLRVRVSWTPFCENDPSWVPVVWPDGRALEQGESLTLEAGELLDLGTTALPPDGDADGMDDVWELAWGLDPLRDDAAGDPDQDGASNLDEYRADTDPFRPPGGLPVGCEAAGVFWLLPLLRRRRAALVPSAPVSSRSPR